MYRLGGVGTMTYLNKITKNKYHQQEFVELCSSLASTRSCGLNLSETTSLTISHKDKGSLFFVFERM